MRKLTSIQIKNSIKADEKGYTTKLKDIDVNGVPQGCSGFVSDGNSIVYISTDVNPIQNKSHTILYRSAKSFEDFTGGTNHYTNELNLYKDINKFFKKPEIYR